jgi:DNA-binding IclR family transcriptional regulator
MSRANANAQSDADSRVTEGGRLEILHAVAVADGPVTGAEIADMLDVPSGKIYSPLTQLYKLGFLVRRKRSSESPSVFEYAVASGVPTEGDR